MHLVVPFASDLSEACRHVLQDLPLPNLERLLGELAPAGREDGPEGSFSPPQERALATAWGWHGADGALPFAARLAAADGIDVGNEAWGLLTPSHWQLGRSEVILLDPSSLALDALESRALFDAFLPLLESDGFRAEWGAPTRWYIARADLDGLATASLDRVVQRDVDRWLRAAPSGSSAAQARVATMRRLQSEAQLLFYSHPVNEVREARGALSVNSFWLSGCGRAQPAPGSGMPTVADELRAPMLAGDWAAWAEAWRALDASTLAPLLEQARSGTPIALSLCGERSSACFRQRAQPALQRLWQRARGAWQAPAVPALLQSL